MLAPDPVVSDIDKGVTVDIPLDARYWLAVDEIVHHDDVGPGRRIVRSDRRVARGDAQAPDPLPRVKRHAQEGERLAASRRGHEERA